MSRKVVSIIILCLMILGTLPLYSASAGTGEDSASTGTEKSAKAPKSPGSNGELSELTNGTGASANDNFGWNVSYAGDLNGDGIDDIIVGAPYNDSADGTVTDCGVVYIFFGYSGISSGNLNALNANVTIYGANQSDHFGWSVSRGGDIDGSGASVIIGAPDNNTTTSGGLASAGAVYIFNRTALNKTVTIILNATNANYTYYGENAGDKFGHAVASAGNISIDNFTDILVGAPGYNNSRGKVYIISFNSTLNTTGTSNYSKDESPDLSITDANAAGVDSTLSITDNGTIAAIRVYLHITHTYIYDLGVNLTHPDGTKLVLFCHGDAGDDNLYGWYENGTWSGVTASADPLHNISAFVGKYAKGNWVLHACDLVAGDTGTIDEWSVEITYGSPTLGYKGEREGDRFGASIGPLGDVNGDGRDDCIVGAPGWNNDCGRAYIFYGTPMRANKVTHKYNFETGGGTDKWFYYDSYASGTFDTSKYIQYPPDTASTSYSSIAIADGGYVYLDTANAVYWRFNFTVNENPSLLSEIYVCMNTYSEAANSETMYIWNNATSTWMLLNTSALANYNALNGAVTTNVSDYINGTNNNLSLCIYRVDPGPVARYFGIEYVDIILTYHSGMVITGEATGDMLGFSVSNNITNVNGDAFNDTIIGAPGYSSSTGKVYVFNGYSSLPNSANASNANVTFTGATEGDQFGYSVSGAGDLNNDGYNDTIVGAPYNDSADGLTSNCGAIYMFNGSSSMSSSISALDANYTNYGEVAEDNFGFSVSEAGDVNNDGYNDTVVGAPYYGSNDNGKAYVLTCRRATLTVSNWTNQAPATANTGTGDVLMLNMTLTASECTIRVTNIRVNLTGTGADADVSACRLFHDANDNGAYDAGTDVFLGDQTFSGSSLNFTLSFDVAYGTPEKLLLLFNISSGATVGNTVGANLTDCSFISVVRPDNVSSHNFSIQSTNVEITSAVAGDTLTVEVIGTPIAPEFVNQGSTNRTMLNLTFNSSNADNGQITITSINISLTGTGIGAGDNANVSGVTIYNDTNKDGTLSAGDTQLNTTQVFSNGYVVFGNLNFAVYYSAGNYTIFVVYNISSSATIDATVGANVTSKTKISVSGSDSVNTFSTIWSDNSTIIEPANINYTIRNGTTGLEEGAGYRKWGNWTIDPGADPTNSTNWLRIRNTNCSNANQQVVVDFSNTTFNQTTGTGTIPIDGNITFWFFFTNSSSDNNATWAGARYNTTNLTTGSNTFTFNKVGEYIWIVYRMEGIPVILPDGTYTASFTVTAV